MTASGFVYTGELTQAEIIIINTCAFIEPAVQESIDTILDCHAENPGALLVVAGCLSLRYGEELLKPLPEVGLFLTPDRIGALPEILEPHLNVQISGPRLANHGARREAESRILTTPGYAYLRIAEGCSRRCRYCTIPSIRGPLHSADPRVLEEEASFLASNGVRELVLVAQDVTSYGLDRREKKGLVSLLKRIRRVHAIRWIRLMYLHPAGISKDLAHVVNDSENVLPYLDIPFQHVSDVVLRAMGRPWKGDRIRKLVEKLRHDIPGLVLRTTVMVGFPGEREREFKELRSFVESFNIEHLGVFSYSPEEGTTAFRLGDPVPPLEKEQRAQELRSIHWGQAERRNHRRIGQTEQCLVEGVSSETDLLLQGRAWDQAPEVDGVLYITSGKASAAEIHDAVLTAAHGPDLFGEIR